MRLNKWYKDTNRYSICRMIGEVILSWELVFLIYYFILYLDKIYVW